MPLEIQSHAIPHFKADISGKLEPRGLRHDRISMYCQSLLNRAHLLHKGGLGRFVSLSTVPLKKKTKSQVDPCFTHERIISRGSIKRLTHEKILS